eukprot:Opistho-2@46249
MAPTGASVGPSVCGGGILASLVSGKEPFSQCIVRDSAHHSGRAFIAGTVRAMCAAGRIVQVCSLEWYEPLGCEHAVLDLRSLFAELTPEQLAVAFTGPALPANGIVVVDSLSPLLFMYSHAVIARFLRALSVRGELSVVALVHDDCHPRTDVAVVEYGASSVVVLLPVHGFQGGCGVHVTHRRRTGKILVNTHHYTFAASGCLTIDSEQTFVGVRPVDADGTNGSGRSASMAADIPFRLSLSAAERAARSRVVLPYTRAQQSAQTNSSDTGVGDDLVDGDDDPDDDLDV